MRRTIVRTLALLVAGCLAVALPACSRGPAGGTSVTADFARGTGLYPGSPVRLLGMDIGQITNVRNLDGKVRVSMRLDDGVRVPADASATIVPLTLLGERYVQLGPAWTSGPTLEDGDRIPIDRTSVPAEIDELLRGLQDFMGAIDPNQASDVVTNLAELLEGRGAAINDLIGDAAGTLDLLADEGEDIEAIISSLRELTDELAGRTDSIESLLRNYELVTEILVANRDDLDGAITELDRATVELTELLTRHRDPLAEDLEVLADTSGLVSANTDNLKLTLASTVKLFEAAGRAYEARTNSLKVNNQLSAELTSDLIAGRLRDRIAGLCRRLGIELCSDPASPLLNDVAGLLPGLLAGTDQAAGEVADALPTEPPPVPAPTTPEVPQLPPAPSIDDLLDALADQLTEDLTDVQRALLETLDAERLAALLGLDPTLLQILGELSDEQVERLREAQPEDLAKVMLELYNEVIPPADRLDQPLLPLPTVPPSGPTPTLPPLLPPGLLPGLGR